jgi:hypothetical protein
LQGPRGGWPIEDFNRHIDGFADMLGGEFHGIDDEVVKLKDGIAELRSRA